VIAWVEVIGGFNHVAAYGAELRPLGFFRFAIRLNADGRNDWLQMAEIAVSCGLEAGYFWKRFPDAPHVQNRYGLTLTEIKEIYRAGHGIKVIWKELKKAA
jgi:hypothetical protein